MEYEVRDKQINDTPEWSEILRREIAMIVQRDNVKTTKAAAEMDLNPSYIKQFLDGKQKSPKIDTVMKLCAYFKIDVRKLFPDILIPRNDVLRSVQVTGYVKAGWAETIEWPKEDWGEIYVPEPEGHSGVPLYGAEVDGPSMNEIYPEGTIVIFSKLHESGESLMPGKRYIFDREKVSGEREQSVKTLHRDETGAYWLYPETSNPLFKEPLPVTNIPEGESLIILGRVVYSIRPE